MNKVEFMRQLEKLLQNISEQERQEALQYYGDYFDDAGPENEQAVLEALGNPARVAENIRRDLYGAGYGDGYEARKPVTGRELTEYGTFVEEPQNQGNVWQNQAAQTGTAQSKVAQGATAQGAAAQGTMAQGTAAQGGAVQGAGHRRSCSRGHGGMARAEYSPACSRMGECRAGSPGTIQESGQGANVRRRHSTDCDPVYHRCSCGSGSAWRSGGHCCGDIGCGAGLGSRLVWHDPRLWHRCLSMYFGRFVCLCRGCGWHRYPSTGWFGTCGRRTNCSEYRHFLPDGYCGHGGCGYPGYIPWHTLALYPKKESGLNCLNVKR